MLRSVQMFRKDSSIRWVEEDCPFSHRSKCSAWFLSAESGIKADGEGCEDLVLRVLFVPRCIAECHNVLSNALGTQYFSPRATVVFQLLILCLSGERYPCGTETIVDAALLPFVLLLFFTVVSEGCWTSVLVLQMAFHRGQSVSQWATAAGFKLFFFVPAHLLLLWFFDTIEEWPDNEAWIAKHKCKLEIAEWHLWNTGGWSQSFSSSGCGLKS